MTGQLAHIARETQRQEQLERALRASQLQVPRPTRARRPGLEAVTAIAAAAFGALTSVARAA
jgi:hypothetical protein